MHEEIAFARRFLAKYPEFHAELRAEIVRAYEEYEGGEPLTAGKVREYALLFMTDYIGSHQAMIDEVLPKERRQQIIREEVTRCMDPVTKAASFEDVEEAARGRMWDVLRETYPHRFPRDSR